MWREPESDADDRRLMSAIADGDEGAFQAFYRRYSATVYTVSRRITGQDHDAQDVVAEVFWELWEKSSRYCPSKATPYTYLIMLTRCRALDRKRRLARRQAHGVLDWATDGKAIIGATELAADQLAHDERRELVAKAVEELEPNLRAAVELTFFDGLTHKATAEKLGIPLGTVKGRVRAALERLRKALQVCKSD
jgi:RNA polymerase sigma-70 factor (ECF subfamily)